MFDTMASRLQAPPLVLAKAPLWPVLRRFVRSRAIELLVVVIGGLASLPCTRHRILMWLRGALRGVFGGTMFTSVVAWLGRSKGRKDVCNGSNVVAELGGPSELPERHSSIVRRGADGDCIADLWRRFNGLAVVVPTWFVQAWRRSVVLSASRGHSVVNIGAAFIGIHLAPRRINDERFTLELIQGLLHAGDTWGSSSWRYFSPDGRFLLLDLHGFRSHHQPHMLVATPGRLSDVARAGAVELRVAALGGLRADRETVPRLLVGDRSRQWAVRLWAGSECSSVDEGQLRKWSVDLSLFRGIQHDAGTVCIPGQPSRTPAARMVDDDTTFALSGTKNRAAPSNLSYPNLAELLPSRRPVREQPTFEGEVERFSVLPSLPDGLSLDPNTGVIQGTPDAFTKETEYRVTASNNAGSTEVMLKFAVRATPRAGYLPIKQYVAQLSALGRPHEDACAQRDGSFLLALDDGSTLRWTVRPDGTWRKPEHKKAGWVGELEQEKYRPGRGLQGVSAARHQEIRRRCREFHRAEGTDPLEDGDMP